MTDNRPTTRLQSSLLKREIEGKSKIPLYTPKSYVTSGEAPTIGYNAVLGLKIRKKN